MKPEALLEQLETAADTLGVRVSYEPLQASVGHGGLCRVKGQYRVIIDKRATPQERVTTLGAALARVWIGGQGMAPGGGDKIELPAKVRDALEFYAPRELKSRAS